MSTTDKLLIAAGFGVLMLLVGGEIWLRGQLTYRVGREFLRVMLFNLTLRKIALADITRVSTRVRGRVERWANTHWPSHRQLVIYHKGSKWPLVITPANRYVVKAELAQVIGSSSLEDDTAFREGEDGDEAKD